MGELNFNDEDGTPIIILCYVQAQSIKGHDNFVLISNNTLDDIQTDINYHSIFPLSDEFDFDLFGALSCLAPGSALHSGSFILWPI